MKIEKLTENKIRIVLKLEELTNKNIDLHDFMVDNLKSQKFFIDILDKADKEVGFNTKDCKLLIEAFSSLDDVFVFTITKYLSSKKKKLLINKKQNKYSLTTPIYSFNSFEEFCVLCEFLNKSNLPLSNIADYISLYLYNDTYYLVFKKINLTYKHLKKLFSVLSEFGTIIKNGENFESKLLEYGKIIIKKNAFKTGIKYFYD